jgi:hypothetical protein
MKTHQSRRQIAKVSHSRWLAYATASAATALADSHSAEAAIHYSGRLNAAFPRNGLTIKTFQLDQPGDSIWFYHVGYTFSAFYGKANFENFGIASAAFRGAGTLFDVYQVAKLSFGQNISSGKFSHARGYMAQSSLFLWADPGVGFVGFRFNNGAGIQYGWARVRMGGSENKNAFKLLDYAYADPGEQIKAGQRSSDEQAPDQGSADEDAPDQGCLGGLALGAVGLLAWRKSRSRAARLAATSHEHYCANE